MNSRNLKLKRYLGDGAYAGYDSDTQMIWLWTSDGLVEKNWIALEPETRAAVSQYLLDFLAVDKATASALQSQL